MILQIAVLAFGLAVWGAHPLAPPSLEPAARRRGALLALPLAAAALMGMFAATAARPDAALAVGLGPGWPTSTEGRLTAVLLLAGLCSDAAALLLAKDSEESGSGLAALLGTAGLLGFALWGELMRLGEGPVASASLFWTAVLLRMLVGLGSGELLLPRRPRLAPWSALALLTYPLVLPDLLRDALQRGGDWLNLAAAGVLFLGARLLPGWLGRVALAAAVVLAAIFFERVVGLGQQLQQVVPQLLQAPTGR